MTMRMPRRWRMSASAVGVVLALLIVATIVPAGLRPGVGAQPEDAALLRELAERLLTPPFPSPDGRVPTTELLLGRLPDAPALDLPVPPGGRLLGSVVRRFTAPGDVSGVSVEAVYDAAGRAQDVAAFYDDELARRGYTPASFGGPGGSTPGFQPTVTTINRAFCPPAGAGFLNLTIFPRGEQPVDVRARLEGAGHGPCGDGGKPGAPPDRPFPPGLDRLPPLFAPEGVQVQPVGGGGGPNRFSSAAIALTDLGVAELQAFFAQQVEAAGWRQLAGRADGPLAWATYQVPGAGDFQGFLYVLQAAGENRRDLYVQVESAIPPLGPGVVPVGAPQPGTTPATRPTVGTPVPISPPVVSGPVPTPAVPAVVLPPSVPSRTFPETGFTVGGRFLEYWEANGGLALNGYPLTNERLERLEDGKEYTVQYFERVRLEKHPENSPPNDVLLGQFGRRIHPADPPVPPPGGPITQDGFYFTETGHYVPGRFFGFWNANGGLRQFGYPISEAFEETLEDGRAYRVQYFERARLEYHPENPPPYDVLLGQFGRRILAESAGH